MIQQLLNDNVENKTIHDKYVHFSSIKQGYKIPNIVHMTFCSTNVPLPMYNVIKQNKQKSSNCKFKFYDDDMCDALIKTHFIPEIYNAYLSINPVYGAMRADFFRYCVLYLIGGIYVDIKSSINYSLFKIIGKEDTCILDLPRNHAEPWRRNNPTYEQWLLIFAPNHPYLHNMINLMVQYINNKYIPKLLNVLKPSTKQQILNVTGPDAFTKAVNSEIIIQQKQLHRIINYDKYFEIIGCPNYKKMYTINNKKHYSEMNLPLYK
jgi:mannosyltransferase OCH1-like enzyme